MEKRLYDILNLKVYEWVANCSSAYVAEIDTKCQEELLEHKYDTRANSL
jgi:hypothetical protein